MHQFGFHTFSKAVRVPKAWYLHTFTVSPMEMSIFAPIWFSYILKCCQSAQGLRFTHIYFLPKRDVHFCADLVHIHLKKLSECSKLQIYIHLRPPRWSIHPCADLVPINYQGLSEPPSLVFTHIYHLDGDDHLCAKLVFIHSQQLSKCPKVNIHTHLPCTLWRCPFLRRFGFHTFAKAVRVSKV